MITIDVSLRDRIAEYLEREGISMYELARKSGVGANHIGHVMSGRIRMPRGDTLLKLSKTMGISVDELVSEEPAQYGRIQLVEPKDHDDLRPVHSRPVPIEAVVAGGDPREAEKVVDEHYELLNHLYSPGRYVIRLFGDSMWPTYHNGDLLLVDSKAKVKDGETAVVRVGGESTVKRVFRKKRGAGLILKADNPTFPPIETDDEEVDVIAKVLKIVEGERS